MVRDSQPSHAERREPGNGRRPPGKRNRLLANGLVALSSAAVVAVYVTGYVQTESAAAGMAPLTPTAGVGAAPTATAPLRTTLITPVPPSAPAPARPAPPARSERSGRTPPTPAAPLPTSPTPAAPAATTAPLRDGSYVGTGRSRHGNLQATVVVQGGAIVSAQITQCGTRYPCSRIAQLPGQVVARQSANVDVVSGATDSAVAYKQAVAAALAQAR